jgi:hypothetical protein
MPKSSKKSRSSKKSKSSRSKTAYRFSVHVKKSPRKSLKRSSRKSSKKSKSKSKATPWLAHVKAVYKEGLKKNKDYKFSQALKDAKKTYKK